MYLLTHNQVVNKLTHTEVRDEFYLLTTKLTTKVRQKYEDKILTLASILQ